MTRQLGGVLHDWSTEIPRKTLPLQGRYLLISDLHLGDGQQTDLFRGQDDAFVRLLESQQDLDGIILNGDILDAAQSPDPQKILQAHGQLLACLRRIAQQTPVYHVVGNHDEPGHIEALLPEVVLCGGIEIGDKLALIVHGHFFDVHFASGPLSGKGGRSLRAHSMVEQVTRCFIRLPFANHDNIVNRMAHWLFYRFTQARHLWARAQALGGNQEPLRRWAAHHDYWARSQWGDSHAMLIPVLAALAAGEHQMLITGHSHQAGVLRDLKHEPTEAVSGQPKLPWRQQNHRSPSRQALAGRTYANLGSWTFGDTPYGIWERGGLRMYNWRRDREITDEAYRFPLLADQIPGMREWWHRYYRGLLRYDTEKVRQDLGVFSDAILA